MQNLPIHQSGQERLIFFVPSSDAGLCAASRLLCRVGVPVTEPLVSVDTDDTEEAGDPRSRLLREPSSSARSGVCLGILIMVGVPLLLELRPGETWTNYHFLLQTQIFSVKAILKQTEVTLSHLILKKEKNVCIKLHFDFYSVNPKVGGGHTNSKRNKG